MEVPCLHPLSTRAPALDHSHLSLALTLQLGGSRNLVRTVALGLALSVVDADLDACVISPVGAGEADRGSGP